MRYALYLPPGYRSTESHALVVFLHGEGDGGDDPRTPLKPGLGAYIATRLSSKVAPDFVAFFPLSRSGRWKPGSDDGVLLLETLKHVQKRYNTDGRRVYLTGISGGAEAVWRLAARFPRKWAAIVPVAGYANPSIAPKLRDIPCWCFHSTTDDVVKISNAHAIVEGLERAGAKPVHTEFTKRGHDIWIHAYFTPGLFDWLLRQQLPAKQDKNS